MRDDIHKHAPLPRRWQGVMREFRSEVERASAGIVVERAIARDAKELIGQGLLHQLVSQAEGGQLALSGFGDSPLVPVLDGAHTELELAVVETLQRTIGETTSRSSAVREALVEVLETRLRANCDAMETTWYLHALGDPEARQAAREMWQAHAACNIAAIVDDVLAGRTPNCLEQGQKQVNIDENLLTNSQRKGASG